MYSLIKSLACYKRICGNFPMRGKSSAKTVICRVVMFKLLKFGDIAFENLLFFF